MNRLFPLLLAFFLLAPAAAPAQELARKLLAATTPKERIDLKKQLLAAAPDPREAAKWFAEGRAYSAEVEKGWRELTVQGSDGRPRPYVLFVPEDYDPAQRYLLLIDMHGGVSRPQPLGHAQLKRMMNFFWASHAAEQKFLLVAPSGQAGAEWWTELGAGNVLRILRDTKRTYNVDENRVYATGFSDGASGSFYLALTHPTPFAGFLPLNGHVAVAGARGLQVHLRNLVNTPLYIVNTGRDSLYPSAAVRPFIELMKKLGVNHIWHDIPDVTHNPTYFPQEKPLLWQWMGRTVRTPHPKRVVWEGTSDAPRRVHWLRVRSLGKTANEAEFEDANPEIGGGRAKIGISIDINFRGPGVRVNQVIDDSAAAQAGLKRGDTILKLDGDDIADARALGAALRTRRGGQEFTLEFDRAGKTMTGKGRFPAESMRSAFRREKRFGTIVVRAQDNTFEVRQQGIRSFELFLSEPFVDLSKPIVVNVNGAAVHSGVVAPDLEFLIDQAMKDEDRTLVYVAKLSVELEPRDG